jgi:hypothetical protein
MRIRLVGILAGSLLVAGVLIVGVQAAGRQRPGSGDSATQLSEVLSKYCITCHNSRLKSGDLSLDRVDLAHIAQNAEIWENVVRKMRTAAMPPQGLPRPDEATYRSVTTYLETVLDQASSAAAHPGRAPARRLNRTEYSNSIRDLLAISFDVTTLLPPDDAAFGFDNIADALGTSPVLLERYLAAAETVSAVALGSPTLARPAEHTYRVPAGLTQTRHIDGLPLGTRGGLPVTHTFPLDGEYIIRPRLWETNNGVIRGLLETLPHDLEISIDGERVHVVTLDGRPKPGQQRGAAAADLDEQLPIRVGVKAGVHRVAVTFLQRGNVEVPAVMQPFQSVLDPVDANGMPQLDRVTVSGPFNPTGPGDTPSRRHILECAPATPAEERACATRIVRTLARRAFRRPISDADLQPLLAFYEQGRAARDFEGGIELALRRILADPQFIFRIERDRPGARADAPSPVHDVDLASRLSFFLWSSLPDDELLTMAERGRLTDRGELDRQVRRMLADPRSSALVDNFAAQWLQLRNLRAAVPDQNEFPDFDENLRQALRRETELLFESILREDRSVLDLLNADYTFVNERLARHYGMPGIYGSQFRRVPVPSVERRGLLGHGSMLTVTSRAERTSPVLRGKWVLENLLGMAPPPPPPDVPELPPHEEGSSPKTMREQLAAHRASPSCASCHKLMDPIGFALENFDAVGAWRTREGPVPIDASGELFDGTRIDGAAGLRQALLRRPEVFVSTLTEKLFTYALGRGLDAYDMPRVRAVVRQAAVMNYRLSDIVAGIVQSDAFRTRMAGGG